MVDSAVITVETVKRVEKLERVNRLITVDAVGLKRKYYYYFQRSNIYFKFRFSLENPTNTYSMLRIRVV